MNKFYDGLFDRETISAIALRFAYSDLELRKIFSRFTHVCVLTIRYAGRSDITLRMFISRVIYV